MKIFHINCNYIGTTLHQLMIEKLETMGIENRVFVPTYDFKTAVIKPNKNVNVAECFNKRDRAIFDYKQKKIYKAIEKEENIEKYDLIHAYTLFTDGNNAMKLSEKYNIPYVVAVRNTDVNTFFKYMVHLRKRGLKIMRNASAVFFLSPMYKKQVFEKYIPEKYWQEIEEKTYIMPNGIDDFWFENQVELKKIKDQKSLNVFYAGGIDHNKNITTTQKALEKLRERGYETKFTVVGKVKNTKVFEEIKKDKYTEYKAARPKEKLIKEYRENDIFVMPSLTETFGLVYAEAMSQGLPVIYTEGQGFDGQFKEGEVGYRVNPLEPEDIADKIEKILDNYDQMSSKCIENSEKFQWNEICSKYRKIYEKVLEE